MSAEQKTILIVGANGALGRLIASKLSTAGYSVIGTARTNESAANLPTTLKQGLLLDLESQDSINTLTNYIAQNPLDGIVITSGMVGFGSIQDTSAVNASRLMQINHLGPAALISALLPTLANSTNEPFVASISGVVAEKVFPGMSAYVASKTAHSTWLRAFAMEARRVKVRVLDSRPGHTETGLATRALFGTAPAFPAGFSPDHVAETIVKGIIEGLTELPSESFTQ